MADTKDYRHRGPATMCTYYINGTDPIIRDEKAPACDIWEKIEYDPKKDGHPCPGLFVGICRYFDI